MVEKIELYFHLRQGLEFVDYYVEGKAVLMVENVQPLKDHFLAKNVSCFFSAPARAISANAVAQNLAVRAEPDTALTAGCFMSVRSARVASWYLVREKFWA